MSEKKVTSVRLNASFVESLRERHTHRLADALSERVLEGPSPQLPKPEAQTQLSLYLSTEVRERLQLEADAQGVKRAGVLRAYLAELLEG